MNMDRALEEKSELAKTSPFNLSITQEGYMEMNQLISSVSLEEDQYGSNYLEMEFPINLKRSLTDSYSIATQNNEKFHLDKLQKHSSNPNMKMQYESNPFSAMLRDYEKCRFAKKSQSAPTLVAKTEEKSKSSEKSSFNKNLKEMDYSQKLPSINTRLTSSEAQVDQIHNNQHAKPTTGRPTPLSVLLKLAKKQNSTIPFSLSKFRKSLKTKEIPTFFKGKKRQSAETITKTQTPQTSDKCNDKTASKYTCVSLTQQEPSNDYLDMKPGSQQTSVYMSMSKDENMNEDSTNQALYRGLNYFQNTSDYMTMNRQEALVKDKQLFQPLYISECMGSNEDKNLSFKMNESCSIPQKENDLLNSSKSSKPMSNRLLPLGDNQKLNYHNILPTTKSGFSKLFTQSKSANLYHLTTSDKNGEINQKRNKDPLSETLDNYPVSPQAFPGIQKHPNRLLQVSIPSRNSTLETAEGDYVLLSSKESPNYEEMNFLSSYQHSVIPSSLYNGSLSDCSIDHLPIFENRNVYDGLKSGKKTSSNGENIHTLLRKQKSISLDKSLNPTIKTSLHHRKSSYPVLSNSSTNKSAPGLSLCQENSPLGITKPDSSIQYPDQNSQSDMPNLIHSLNLTNVERKPQPMKRQVISVETIKSGDLHFPEDSQPPQKSPGLNLNYALLDLTPIESDREKIQSLRSTTIQTPIVQSTQEIPLSYAQIDFAKSEGLRNTSHGLRGGKV
ncbi:AF4/FMR2 family member 4-like isoform X2 [Limulus polyphemus]|uniref:AF4/FMR2 family member 4-like isoform X2 n=1 Tax=Limulus polyphemus TaxID=6850 RepID=A0ABM1S982_LIMPO|nr:AF4/FMR2 family member 4-like isoform X2 [Limulus polyphemus]